MTATETIHTLIDWTPYLAVGFLWNLLVACAAMAIGTPFGIGLAIMRCSRHSYWRRKGSLLTSLARNVPTFIMLFYLAYALPNAFTLFGIPLTIPPWIKSSLALGIAVAAFVSDNARIGLLHLRKRARREAALFLPSWIMYFLIIIMASSTASMVGVQEVVARANTIIGAIEEPGIALWVYLYVMAWFIAVCWPLDGGLRWLRRRLEGGAAPAQMPGLQRHKNAIRS